MGTYTPLHNLYKISPGEQDWGDKVNNNFITIDTVSPIYVRSPEEFVYALIQYYEGDNHKIVLANDIEFPKYTILYILGNTKVHIDLHYHVLKNIELRYSSLYNAITTVCVSDGVLSNVHFTNDNEGRLWGNIDWGEMVEETDGTENDISDMTFILLNCTVLNTNRCIDFTNSKIQTNIVNVHFDACMSAVTTLGTCTISDCYFNNCVQGVSVHNDDGLYTIIKRTTFDSGDTALMLEGKTFMLYDVIIAKCKKCGIIFKPSYNDSALILYNCTIHGIICNTDILPERGGIYVEGPGTTITGTSVVIDGGSITGCDCYGIRYGTVPDFDIQIVLRNGVHIYKNYVRDGETISLRNVDITTIKPHFDGVVTNTIGIYHADAEEGGVFGTCTDDTFCEYNIICDNKRLKAVRDGTTLKWAAF